MATTSGEHNVRESLHENRSVAHNHHAHIHIHTSNIHFESFRLCFTMEDTFEVQHKSYKLSGFLRSQLLQVVWARCFSGWRSRLPLSQMRCIFMCFCWHHFAVWCAISCEELGTIAVMGDERRSSSWLVVYIDDVTAHLNTQTLTLRAFEWKWTATRPVYMLILSGRRPDGVNYIHT